VKILLDHCLPRRLKRLFPEHEISSAGEVGWENLRNGRLLAAAGTKFDVFLTIDKNLRYQQNPAKLPISVVVIMAPTNRFEDLAPFAPEIKRTLERLTPGALVEVFLPPLQDLHRA